VRNLKAVGGEAARAAAAAVTAAAAAAAVTAAAVAVAAAAAAATVGTKVALMLTGMVRNAPGMTGPRGGLAPARILEVAAVEHLEAEPAQED
tara:strand:- start:505 stop:780 length:276 start_codon:yes stop_codon:yes gene_type:complete